MKCSLFSIIFSVSTVWCISQTNKIGIGTGFSHPSAKVDLSADTSGILIPRMTSLQRAAIDSAATGLLVYQTDGTTGFYHFNGSAWVNITEGVIPGSDGFINLDNSFITTVSTLAGPNINNSPESFSKPCAVEINSRGNVFVTDPGNYCIREVTGAGAVITYKRQQPGSGYPCGLASSYNVDVVADTSADVILYPNPNFSASNVLIPLTGTAYPYSSTGIAGARDGRADSATFNSPFSIVQSPNGNSVFYITDRGNNKIRKLTYSPSFTTTNQVSTVSSFAGGGSTGTMGGYLDGPASVALFNAPKGIAADNAGNLYVSDGDANNCRIRKITPVGAVTTLAGSRRGYADGTGQAAMFNDPTGIAVDGYNNVYVADAGNNRIRKITPVGVVTTIAGTGRAGDTNGNGKTAAFNQPFDVAVSGDGSVIYVADLNNNKVRKIAIENVRSIYATTAEILNRVQTDLIVTPSTGGNNLIPASFGSTSDNAVNNFESSSGNCRLDHVTGTGIYTITFTGTNLSDVSIGNLPVIVSIKGKDAGRIVWRGDSGTGDSTGVIRVFTFDTTGKSADRGFSFVVYKP